MSALELWRWAILPITTGVVIGLFILMGVFKWEKSSEKLIVSVIVVEILLVFTAVFWFFHWWWRGITLTVH